MVRECLKLMFDKDNKIADLTIHVFYERFSCFL